MAKKLAHKTNKQLLTESEIKEQRLNIGEFSSNWNGRVAVIDPKNSVIAQQMGFEKEGEYAIKVR